MQRFFPTRQGKGKAKGQALPKSPPPGSSSSSSSVEKEVGTAGLAKLSIESERDKEEYAILARHVPLPDDTETDGDVTWAVDSEASHHMCETPDNLTDVHPGRPVTISLANRATTRATTRGTAVLRVNGTRLTMRNVLVVPLMGMPLFSARTAWRARYTTDFTDCGVRVHPDG